MILLFAMPRLLFFFFKPSTILCYLSEFVPLMCCYTCICFWLVCAVLTKFLQLTSKICVNNVQDFAIFFIILHCPHCGIYFQYLRKFYYRIVQVWEGPGAFLSDGEKMYWSFKKKISISISSMMIKPKVI